MQIFQALGVLLGLLVSSCLSKKRWGDSSKIESFQASTVVSVSGIPFRFSDSNAASVLSAWAKDMNFNSGSVSLADASWRESHVVQMVNSGVWDVSSYHEYQRLAAATGNVDSARLLLTYAVSQSIAEAMSFDGPIGRLFVAISKCRPRKALNIIHHHGLPLDISLPDGTNLIMAAARSGCSEIVRSIILNMKLENLDHSASINAVGTHGMTPLMIAAASGHIGVLKELLYEDDTDVNAVHQFSGNTALHFAAEMDQYSAIDLLCLHGINSTIMSKTTSNALHVAAQSHASNTTIFILVKQCNIPVDSFLNNDTTALYLAAQHGSYEVARSLVELGSNVSLAMPISITTSRLSMVKSSDSYSQIVNAEAANGAEPIHAAAESCHPDIVDLLLKSGAQWDTQSMGVTPLHLAVQYNCLAVVEVLLAHLKSHYSSTAQELLIDLDSKILGSSSLEIAVRNKNIAIIKLLLEFGSNPLHRNHLNQDVSPLRLSFAMKSKEIASMLVSVLKRRMTDENSTQLCDVSRHELHLSIFAAVAQENFNLVSLVLIPELTSSLFDDNDDNGQSFFHYLIQTNNFEFSYRVMRRVMFLYGSCIEVSVFTTCSFDARIQHALTKARLSDGLSPVHLACSFGNIELLEMIRDLSVDIHQFTEVKSAYPDGLSCLHLAVKHVSDKSLRNTMLRRLFSLGFNVSQKTLISEKSILALALEKKDIEIVRNVVDLWISNNLIEIGDAHMDGDFMRKIKRVSDHPLLYAVMLGFSEAVSVLLDAGFNCGIQIATKSSPKPQTLLELAHNKRDFEVIKILSSHPSCMFELSSDS